MGGLEAAQQSAPEPAEMVNPVRVRGWERDRPRPESQTKTSGRGLKTTTREMWAKAEGSEA